ncbi:hypothetical protein AB0H71_26425 [Nocardia sp. NPDC050697]|uniref:hypothetical protein n=1 Tax=Nocardia sp. NPDC050697 TaxID=3155158 RepID=UPI0033D2E682
MTESFKASPAEVAGLGVLVASVGSDAVAAATFIQQHGKPADWLHGPIIDELLTPIRNAADASFKRMGDIGMLTSQTGGELKKAAWLYHDQEARNYEALNANKVNLGHRDQPVPVLTDREADGYVSAYEGAAQYAKPEEFKLDVPQANKEDTAALIAEVSPVLGNVNESIKSITRFAGKEIDPLGEALKPIPGNWNEVRRVGEAYKIAGNGMEACGKNLEAATSRAGAEWDGAAALAYEDWARRQIAAMKWEGPVGRIVSDILGEVADKIRNAVKTILTKLWELLESRFDLSSIRGALKTIANKIPVVGTAKEIAEIGQKLYDIIRTAVNLVLDIVNLRDKVVKLIEVVSDPLGTARNKAEEHLEKTIEPFSKNAARAKDLVSVGQLGDTLDRPQTDYQVGTGQRPWEDG